VTPEQHSKGGCDAQNSLGNTRLDRAVSDRIDRIKCRRDEPEAPSQANHPPPSWRTSEQRHHQLFVFVGWPACRCESSAEEQIRTAGITRRPSNVPKAKIAPACGFRSKQMKAASFFIVFFREKHQKALSAASLAPSRRTGFTSEIQPCIPGMMSGSSRSTSCRAMPGRTRGSYRMLRRYWS
jgi:hypothetical protein